MRNLLTPVGLWWGLLLQAGLTQLPAADTVFSEQTLPTLTNTAQLRQLADDPQRVLYPVRLEGIVCAANSEQGVLFLQDETGVAIIKLNLQGQPVPPGTRVRVTGTGVVEGMNLQLGAPSLVDNDGVHAMTERSGMAYLAAGWQPIRVVWFNGGTLLGLEAYYQGPDLPRQSIPDSALFREQVDSRNGTTNRVAGMNYRCFEGTNWIRLPDFNQLTPVKTGTVTNLDLSVIRRTNDVGLEFTGYLAVPRAGLYTFTTLSDDGSRLYLGETQSHLEVIAPGPPPVPRLVVISRALSEEEDQLWSQVEGTVTFLTELSDGCELELSSGAGRMRVKVDSRSGGAPPFLLNSQVRAKGICQSTYTSEGQKVAGALRVADWKQIELTQVAAEYWSAALPATIASLEATNSFARTNNTIVRVEGRLRRAASDASWVLEDDTGQMPATGIQVPPESVGVRVELLGTVKREGATSALQIGFQRPLIETMTTNGTSAVLPVLTSAKQIHYLSRLEAQRAYPVRIRGVVISTISWRNSFVLQDATHGIFVRGLTEGTPPQIGDFREVEGVTDAGNFAPTVLAQRMTYLGAGRMPDPIRPNRDQIINGSLDAQYVELQGIVTGIEPNGVRLLMLAGKYKVELPNMSSRNLARFENALVRIRGCFITSWDAQTRQIRIGQIRIFNGSFNVDEPAAADVFSAPVKTPEELMLFDAQASALKHIKVAGQIVHERAGEYYLMTGTNGLRFFLKSPLPLALGEQVEVVGFPELGGASPVLREAIVRKTGTVPLPKAEGLTAATLLSANHDATLVSLESLLVGFRTNQSEQVLELQAGPRTYLARLAFISGLMKPVPLGSRLQLTGVYAGQGGDRAEGRDIDSFELLLNSPTDIHVLQRPAWWTIRHTLFVVGALAVVLLLAIAWIRGLRREVELQTRKLKTEIQEHKQTEAQLVGEIDERKRIELEIERVHKQLMEASRLGGMAEIATNVLHNVGNVLNSVNISAGLITEHVKKSKAASLTRVVALLQEHTHDLGEFITADSRGKHLPVHLAQLSEQLMTEQKTIISELDLLHRNIQHIKEIVAMQQNYARVGGVKEMIDVVSLVEDSLHMNVGSMVRHRVEVIREFEPVPPMNVEKHKILQILVNLVRNAKFACDESGRTDKKLTVRVASGEGRIRISVADNGVGIPPENLTRIFNHGFTTRKDGHGFGLHSGALAAKEMGGSLTVHSDGPGLGANFILELPSQSPQGQTNNQRDTTIEPTVQE